MTQPLRYLKVHEELVDHLRKAETTAQRLKNLTPPQNVEEARADDSFEDVLIDFSQKSLSVCNWQIGEAAFLWAKKFARGRADADFGALVGLSGEQVEQRREVWATFHGTYKRFPSLRWSHFYAAMEWVGSDACECLQWAEDMRATVAEMKAWRRAQHG